MHTLPRKMKKKPMAEMNDVPDIDVMLVLLVVFMVTTPMLMQGVEVDLPQAPSAPVEEQDAEPLIVSVKRDGTYYINLGANPEQRRPLEEAQDTVERVLREQPSTSVVVWGDDNVS